MTLCLSCASVMPHSARPTVENRTVLEIQHARSRKSSDCLAVCASMVLKYYHVQTVVPDTVMPLELFSLSRRLNTDTPVDSEGHVLFATVLELTPVEMAAQLAKKRPLIVAFKPSGRDEYHSVVLSGYSPGRDRFFINDPARRKPKWKSISSLRTYSNSGKYLVLLIGLSEK
jgi:hypothetical protein